VVDTTARSGLCYSALHTVRSLTYEVLRLIRSDDRVRILASIVIVFGDTSLVAGHQHRYNPNPPNKRQPPRPFLSCLSHPCKAIFLKDIQQHTAHMVGRPSTWWCSSPTKSCSKSSSSRRTTIPTSCCHNHHSKKMLRIQNLPHDADAAALLAFLNREARRFFQQKQVYTNTSNSNNNNITLSNETPTPLATPPPTTTYIHNVLVFGSVALAGCSSVRVAETILHECIEPQKRRSNQTKNVRPLIYQGRVLELGRPRNYRDGEDSQRKGTTATTRRRALGPMTNTNKV
jgi:hypothetical protein